ncbi:hypothetical protein C9J85_00935 [Haloferax sp. wsp5]|nr:hypothetical protein C9J85_00935 [Haloferax sp. wsp5]
MREARTQGSRSLVPKQADSPAEARETIESAHIATRAADATQGRPPRPQYPCPAATGSYLSTIRNCCRFGKSTKLVSPDSTVRGHLDVVMMATMAQYERLAEKLDGQPYGLASFADERGGRCPSTVRARHVGSVPWDDGTAVMGICNVTPNSFHDGGEFYAVEDAVARAGDG